jgi:hypothetical protein
MQMVSWRALNVLEMHSRLFFIILVLTSCFFCQAQENQFDRGKWKELKEEVNYEENVSGKKKEDKSSSKSENGQSKSKKENPELRSSESNAAPYTINLGPAAQLIVILLFIALIVWLLYTIVGKELFNSQPKNIKISGEIEAHDFSEVPQKTDLERWLDKALSSKDYKTAVRVYFLMTIHQLEKKNLIRWKKEKTNWDYLQDLNGHYLQPSFRERTLDFDLIWYGEKPMSEEVITDKLTDFKTFLGQIDSTVK